MKPNLPRFCALSALALSPALATAMPGGQFQTMSESLFAGASAIVSATSVLNYAFAFIFALVGAFRFKAFMEDPERTSVSAISGPLIVSAFLLALPTALTDVFESLPSREPAALSAGAYAPAPQAATAPTQAVMAREQEGPSAWAPARLDSGDRGNQW